jgi:hypothetical protein
VYITITNEHPIRPRVNPGNRFESSGRHMQTAKHTIWRHWQLIFLILLVAMFPGVAFAHGFEVVVLYMATPGLIMGIITGLICTFIRMSHWWAITRSFVLYLTLLVAYSLYDISGSISWSDVSGIIFFILSFGFVFGGVSLYLGYVATCFILKRILKR